jgi:hypothetical protein
MISQLAAAVAVAAVALVVAAVATEYLVLQMELPAVGRSARATVMSVAALNLPALLVV